MPDSPVYPERVRIVEVGPRDGLQNEPQPVTLEQKLTFIRALADAGLQQIEVTSFVHPKAVPQLADAFDLATSLPTLDGVTWSALVPNDKGLERAMEAGIKRIAVFTAASDSFTGRNIRMTVDESLRVFEGIVPQALRQGMTVRGYVSTAFVCPYEGNVSPERVASVSRSLVEMGIDEVAISDTIGAAAPRDVHAVLDQVIPVCGIDRIALHLHDTYGTALANVYAGLLRGVRTFDASAGGLGGCPYAPGASGNLATEDLVYFLDRMGIETGVSLDAVASAAAGVMQHIEPRQPSRQMARLRAATQHDDPSAMEAG